VLYPVVEVVDGDTVKIRRNGRVETLRLIGLDTPETRDPRRPVECFGREASARGKKLLGGQKVRIVMDRSQGTKDKYGRTLAYLYRQDGLFYNLDMIRAGYANEYTYQNNPYQYQKQFKAAERQAREAERGLWSPKTCDGDANQPADKPVVPKATNTPRPMPPPGGSTGGGSVVIDDVINDGSAEWVVLRNTGSAAVNLQDWSIWAGDDGQTYTLPSYTLAPGAFVRIASGDASGSIEITSENIWNNDGDEATLYDPNGKTIHRYEY